MTCAYWHRYYTFNPVNGDRIDLRDLFTPTGFQAFSKRVIGKRSAKFRREVTLRIKLAEREARLGPLGSIEVDKLEDFYIQGNSIFIDGENCLTKNEKFDGIDMYVRFDLREFKRFLNEYGLAVFGIGRPDISKFRSNGLPQLFKGNVNGSSPFIMLIRNFGNGEVNGIYAYLKYGIGIPLLGTLADGKVELTERIMVDTAENPNTGVSHRYIDGGLISGHLSDEIFTGIWTDSAKTRSYQIRASKY